MGNVIPEIAKERSISYNSIFSIVLHLILSEQQTYDKLSVATLCRQEIRGSTFKSLTNHRRPRNLLVPSMCLRDNTLQSHFLVLCFSQDLLSSRPLLFLRNLKQYLTRAMQGSSWINVAVRCFVLFVCFGPSYGSAKMFTGQFFPGQKTHTPHRQWMGILHAIYTLLE